MRKKLAIIMLSSVMLTGAVLPQTALTVCAEEAQQQQTTTMYATANVNVRAGDSASTKKLGSLTKGQAIAVIGEKTASGWYMVDFNGQTGYVSKKYLTADNATAAPAAAPPVTPETATQTAGVGETKVVNDVTFVCQGFTPNGLKIWCASWDTEGTWPDYLISAYDATGITNDMSDYDKAVAINNYICKTVDYAYDTTGCDERIAYCACLTVGKADCMGYTHAFETLCTMAGVYSGSARGTVANAVHVWNYVSISGVRYWVDVTGNDSCNNAYLMSTTQFADHECTSID